MKQKGFTLVEIIVIIGIFLLISTLAFQSFIQFNKYQALDKNVMLISSAINEARSLTLGSKNAIQYGIHFGESQITLFSGITYIENNVTNIVIPLSNFVRISSISLAGGGLDIVFNRLSGKTYQNGRITLSLVSDPSSIKSIIVYQTGLSEIN